MTEADLEALGRIKGHLKEGRIPEALSGLEMALSQNPEDAELKYLLVLALRYSKQLDKALFVVKELLDLAPSHARAYQELGHIHFLAGNADEAVFAYQRALEINPALLASLERTEFLLEKMGREHGLIRIRSEIDFVKQLPKPLVSVIDLIGQNKLVKAEELCRSFLQKNPQNVEGMRLLADIGSKLGVLHDAEFLLESALEFEPDHIKARIDYIMILRKRQKFESALEQAQLLLETAPSNVQFKSLCAIELMQTGAYDAALNYFDQILEQVPNDPVTLTTRGHLLKTQGNSKEAIDSYRAVLKNSPEHGEAYYSLGNLKTYRFEDDELDLMIRQEQGDRLRAMDRIYLNFALGKAYEDKGDYESAFSFYQKGNSLKKIQSRYDAEAMRDELSRMRLICDPAFFSERADWGSDARDPIFVLGLPRAGSTLIEQILSSHSQIDGTSELPNILALSQKLRRSSSYPVKGYPEVMKSISEAECREFGDSYIEETKIHRQGAAYFIDKMPNNFRHIALIKLILPNAKIIDARRDPMGCCFSGFKQLFAEGQEFSYSLEDIGNYYVDYIKLMDHWDKVLPGFVLRVNHEDVVDNLEQEVRRILNFCGLPFEESCLRFYETERNVKTPSSEQVRQPIFRDGVDQWRKFEPWLDPLKNALAELESRDANAQLV